ncbi:methyltransferase domain-containing protein [Mucilaginibacter sp.]|uniref:class I SAM-dependent methyltransferase n=1 Tax=Mucilaginibacter sp. TaxID=1882438 RepID=UPI00263784F8|nr:methyltransferase domain-containing protein [Mucilaginibacter sp.]MDB4926972.1 hypothetical protein [Mucilaginibacter sp.]
MQLSANLLLNRFDWAQQKTNDIISQYYKNNEAVFYDVGAGENSLATKLGNKTALACSFDLLPFDDNIQQWNIETNFSYDYPAANIVTLLEVVEHLTNPWLCIKNISATMAPGGFLILTTPNPGWSTSRVSLMVKGFLTCFTQSDLDNNHHVFIAWPHILQRLLNDNGFEIIEYVTLDGPTKFFSKDIKLSRFFLQFPARVIKKIIEKTDPTAMGMSYGIIARKID